MLVASARPLTSKMEVLQIMEDFPTDSQPKNVEMSFKREAMATATARYLTTERDIEVWVSQQTVFGQPDAQGQRADQTTFYVRAFCTWDEMKEAAHYALFECIDADLSLIKAGLVSEPKFGASGTTIPGAVHARDYL